MAARGRQPNLSFFAFTATPKYKTLEVFGRPGADGKPVPFHLYTMRQAIEEGFILDVLANYTTYKTYYRLIKAIEDDPEVEKKQAAKALARFMSLHPHNLAQKTEVMVEHFRAHHAPQDRRAGQGDGGHQLAPARRALQAGLRHATSPSRATPTSRRWSPSPARSSTPTCPASTYTEVGMNAGIREKELPEQVRRRRLPGAARRREVPDRLRPAAAAHHVRGQAPLRRAGRADALAPQPHRARQGGHLRPRLRERPEEIYDSFQPYYERDRGRRAGRRRSSSTRCRPSSTPRRSTTTTRSRASAASSSRPRRRQTPGDHAKLNAWLDKAVQRFKERRRARTAPRSARSSAAG